MTAAVCLSDCSTVKWISVKFSENVDNGPRKRCLHFGDVLDAGGNLSFDQPKIKGEYRSQRALIINELVFLQPI